MDVLPTHPKPEGGLASNKCEMSISDESLLNQLSDQVMANSDYFIDEQSVDNEVFEIISNNSNMTERSPKISNEPENSKTVRSELEHVDSKQKEKHCMLPKLQDPDRDIFCWICHKYGEDLIPCGSCPRVFHLKCIQLPTPPFMWRCIECDDIAVSGQNVSRNPPTKELTRDRLKKLLSFVIKRMRHYEMSHYFEDAVSPREYPEYEKYIVKPMYLKRLEANVECSYYNNCEAFLSDAKWMVHNSYIFNSAHSDLTVSARAMIKQAKLECEEILNCPNCYYHAITLDDKWFIEPCEIPHILVWARLKGWPFWPGKVMKVSGNNVLVRFFGEHKKSFVPVGQCYLYSKKSPSKQKKSPNLEVAIMETLEHIEKLETNFGEFRYAPGREVLNPKDEFKQRQLLLPHFHEGMTPEEAVEIRSKVQKKYQKTTNRLMQRSKPRNTPAVDSIKHKQGKYTRQVKIPVPTDKTNSQQMLPVLSKVLPRKSSLRASYSSTISGHDSMLTVAGNSVLNLSGNEQDSSTNAAKLSAVSNMDQTSFLFQLGLQRNPQPQKKL